MFSVVDSTFCGYVPTNAKATVDHMIDTDGTRADLARILREARHGTAFYHSDSQPQPNVETGDDESSDPGEHDSCSEYELARSRSIISTEIRDRLLSERGEFRKALRKFLGAYLPANTPGLAKW